MRSVRLVVRTKELNPKYKREYCVAQFSCPEYLRNWVREGHLKEYLEKHPEDKLVIRAFNGEIAIDEDINVWINQNSMSLK